MSDENVSLVDSFAKAVIDGASVWRTQPLTVSSPTLTLTAKADGSVGYGDVVVEFASHATTAVVDRLGAFVDAYVASLSELMAASDARFYQRGALYIRLATRDRGHDDVLQRFACRFVELRAAYADAHAVRWHEYAMWLNPAVDSLIPAAANATVGVGAVVLSGDRRRVALVWENGSWKIPTGHVDAGETAAAAGAREIREETNLVVDNDDTPPQLVALQERLRASKQKGYKNVFVVYAYTVHECDAIRGDGREIPLDGARWFDVAALLRDGATTLATVTDDAANVTLDGDWGTAPFWGMSLVWLADALSRRRKE
jgi:8-oxo-dGTP pyrophosphatase MutT (NUDIX family)